ncbi:hypothetical protein EYF80_034432 [Liparis tanakae]|uniref:Uncharacterized protein n=1 Tax=Liparis tanakae TaxID=230148 RepID=A0A4Z2GPS9_9TELE|nr:hypothetical protein EYF80_034432 [Liparis tanakae]
MHQEQAFSIMGIFIFLPETKRPRKKASRRAPNVFVFVQYSTVRKLSSLLVSQSPKPINSNSKREYVYSSLFSPFSEVEIRLVECVACCTSRLRHYILVERSGGDATPRQRFSLLVHEPPLSDHWPRRPV